MNVRRALPKIHFDQTLYRKANTCVFAINLWTLPSCYCCSRISFSATNWPTVKLLHDLLVFFSNPSVGFKAGYIHCQIILKGLNKFHCPLGKKKCVFPVSRPTLIFRATLNILFHFLKKSSCFLTYPNLYCLTRNILSNS